MAESHHLLYTCFTPALHLCQVNNNPFEYWITHQSDEYVNLMNDVQRVQRERGTNWCKSGVNQV